MGVGVREADSMDAALRLLLDGKALCHWQAYQTCGLAAAGEADVLANLQERLLSDVLQVPGELSSDSWLQIVGDAAD